MKIVVCDDDKFFLECSRNKIKAYMLENNCSCEIDGFSDVDLLIADINKQEIDIIFLDIDMPKHSGFEMALQIKQKWPRCIIVFCTNHNELVYDSFAYQPFWFLCKDNYDHKMKEILKRAIKKVIDEKSEYIVKKTDNIIKIRHSDIMYIEVSKHRVQIHIFENNEIIEHRGNLSDIEEQFFLAGFVKINSGCIANLKWIYKIKNNEILMKNNDGLIVSRSNKKNVKERFYNYISGEGN